MWILSSPAVDFSPRGLTSLWALATSSNCFRGKAKIALAVSSACTGWVPMIYQIGFSLKFEEIPQKTIFLSGEKNHLSRLQTWQQKYKFAPELVEDSSQNQLGLLVSRRLKIPPASNCSHSKNWPFNPLTASTPNQKPRHHRPLSVLHCYWCSP